MFTIYSNGNRKSYGIKHYDLDTIDDLKLMEKKDITPGSTIFIINSSKYYKLNSQKKWIEIFPYSNSSNGGSDIDDPNYDGGSIDGSDPGQDGPGGGSYDGGSIDGSDPV